MSGFQIPAACVMALVFFPGAAMATDVPLVADTYISGAIPTLNFGGLANLNVGNSANGNVALLKFDLSVLPAAGIARATLRIFVNKVGAAGAIDVLGVSTPWTESSITGQFPPALGAMVATAVPVTASGSYLTVDVTLMVQNWTALGSFYPNNGFAIMANASAPATSIFLDSKESTATSHPATLDVTLNGPAGIQGPAGPVGAMGAAGSIGPQGPQGLAGTAGSPGATGPQGSQGVAGLIGSAGPAGAIGSQGVPGSPGTQGPQGSPGAIGPQGFAGPPGAPGATGDPGTPGLVWRGAWISDPNFHYAAGDAVSFHGSSYIALTANNGAQPDNPQYLGVLWMTLANVGSNGQAGPQGLPGAQGPVGVQGIAGVAGAIGPAGPAGAQGTAGAGWLTIPTSPFFAATVVGGYNAGTIGPGTGVWGISSITFRNDTTQLWEGTIFLASNTGTNCTGVNVTAFPAAPPNLTVVVPANQTLHLTFPTPLVVNGAPYSSQTCIGISGTINSSVGVYVNGFLGT